MKNWKLVTVLVLAFTMSLFMIACSDDDDDPTGDVTGTVTDALSGDPIEGAIVTIAGEDQVTTDANGMYEVLDVFTGTYQVVVAADEYIAVTEEIVIVEGDNTKDFALAPLVTPPEYAILGTWLSAGDDIALLLQGAPFNLDSIRVTFTSDQAILLEQRSFETETWSTYNGTWEITESETGIIHQFTGNYTSPYAFTQEGICSIVDADPDVFTLEAVQTEPDIGAEVPTVDGGFGSTAIGTINVQVYKRVE